MTLPINSSNSFVPYSGKRAVIAEITAMKRARTTRKIPISPLLIQRQAALIQLKREVKNQLLAGGRFSKITEESQNIIGVVKVNNETVGYFKSLTDIHCPINAILEKIRWDIAVLMGDEDMFIPTDTLKAPPTFPNDPGAWGIIQLHQPGKKVREYSITNTVPKWACYKSLLVTFVYGGFDDHLYNQIYNEKSQKIMFFDNASGMPSHNGYLDWVGIFRTFVRPAILGIDFMGESFTSHDVQLILNELKRYRSGIGLVKAYFARPDIQKLISILPAGWIDTEKSVKAMEDRINVFEEVLKANTISITPREWLFKSFKLYKFAVAIMYASDLNLNPTDLFIEVGKSCLNEALEKIVEDERDPLDVLKIAQEHDSLEVIMTKIQDLEKSDIKKCEEGKEAVQKFLKENSIVEHKDSLHDPKDYALETAKLLDEAGVDNQILETELKIKELVAEVTPNRELVFNHNGISYPPVSVEEVSQIVNGKVPIKMQQFEKFLLELNAHAVRVYSCRLFEMRHFKVDLPPSEYVVLQIKDDPVGRFILAEKDEKGNVFSKEIGLNIEPIKEAMRRQALASRKVSLIFAHTSLFIDSREYLARPGEAAGTYVIQVGNLELPPMLYPEEVLRYPQGLKIEMAVLNEFNRANTRVMERREIKSAQFTLGPGEHIIVQEKERTPSKFYALQNYNNQIYTYTLFLMSNGMIKVSDIVGRPYYKTAIEIVTKLKYGLKLVGDLNATSAT